MSESRRGFLLGLAAYSMWGLFPLYWPLLKPAGAIEILSHRIFWSLVVVAALIAITGRASSLRHLLRSARERNLLTFAALIISVNWGVYIWGVNNGHVVETSLGYFINPLVTLLLGVVLLGERLRPVQWAAMGLAGVAVLILTLDYGRPPWISLVLAFSFGTYGLLKKKAHVGAIESLTVETLILGPVAFVYLAFLGGVGDASYLDGDSGHLMLLAMSGFVTAIPLLFFGAAATRVSMTTLGLQQYLAPTIQLALGVLVLGEQMPTVRWIGFAIVWVALAIFTTDSIRHHRRRQMALAVSAAAA
jgi:chloramphenicol-sensitive protein RarD